MVADGVDAEGAVAVDPGGEGAGGGEGQRLADRRLAGELAARQVEGSEDDLADPPGRAAKPHPERLRPGRRDDEVEGPGAAVADEAQAAVGPRPEAADRGVGESGGHLRFSSQVHFRYTAEAVIRR